jgi:hypothetical protein
MQVMAADHALRRIGVAGLESNQHMNREDQRFIILFAVSDFSKSNLV